MRQVNLFVRESRDGLPAEARGIPILFHCVPVGLNVLQCSVVKKHGNK